VGQAGEPLAEQPVDQERGQTIADLLGADWIGARQQAIVQGLKGDAVLGQLALEYACPFRQSLAVYGK